jgi:trk system potassium uptake protein TrkH
MGSLLWAYILMISAGFCVLRLPASTTRGNELTVDRAIFSTINAATLTGFQQAHDIDTYKLPGQLTIFFLTVGGTLFALIAGGLALVRIMRLPYTDEQIFTTSIVMELIVLLIGWLGGLITHRPAFEAIFDTTSAFGSSGVWLGGILTAQQPITHVVLLPLAILGGLGVPVVLDCVGSVHKRRPLARHSGITLASSAILYLFVVFTLLYFQGFFDPIARGEWPDPTILKQSSAIAINARSPGLPISMMYTRTLAWFLLLLMIIGGNSGSAGGGLKATTVVRFFKGGWDSLRGRAPGSGYGIAMTWILGYFAVVGVAMFVLLGTDPDQPMDRLLFLAVSAMSNIGLSHEPVAIVGTGLHTLSVVMLIGRLAPLFVLWWLAKTSDENIGIG